MAKSPAVVSEPTDLWAARVAAGGEFIDRRLAARFADLLARWAARPADSIPQACGEWSQAKAAYRFLDNPRVTAAALLRAYVNTTVRAGRRLPVVYILHDSTSFNYSSLKTTAGLGPINDSPYGRGLHLHTSLAVRPDGTPLGLMHQRYWARPIDKRAVPPQQRGPDDRESVKWLDGVRAAETAFARLSADERPRLIHVCDREGDITDLLRHIAAGTDGLVIRNQYDRNVAGPTSSAHAAVAAARPLGRYTVAVAATAKCPARDAVMEVRAVPLTLHPATGSKAPIRCSLVEAREVGPPAGSGEPLHWRLWTTEPAKTFAQARAVIAIYQRRPRIEEFHLVLKSGCRVEQLALETVGRLHKALVIYSGIAVRIATLRDLARHQPRAACTRVLTADEWQALVTHFGGEPLGPATRPPTVAQAVRWIARRGGHLGRKHDGPPGVRTLWRGWRDLHILTEGFRAGRQLSAA
jgi:Transposase DNA-binding/Transposase Tn5 dimerisation domain